jgi:hypothetical protein
MTETTRKTRAENFKIKMDEDDLEGFSSRWLMMNAEHTQNFI